MNKMKLQIVLASLTILVIGCSPQKQNEENIIKVKTVAVSTSSVTGEENYAGTIEEMTGTSLSFANAGTIKVLNVQEGQNVRAGQLIGVLDAQDPSNGVAIANATVAQARAQLKQAHDAYHRELSGSIGHAVEPFPHAPCLCGQSRRNAHAHRYAAQPGHRRGAY